MSSIKKAKKAKSSSSSSKRSLERKDISRTWMYIDGALAWTKRQILIPNNDKKDVKKDAVFCWWPTILFSSWKSATMSGLMCDMSEVEMPSSTQEALTDQFRVGPRVKIHDIELRPYVTQLHFNLVPRKAALGKRNTMNLRNNVVGHYLGLNYAGTEEGEEAQWARISVEDVRGPFRDFTISAMNSTKSILDVRKLTLKESEKVYEKIISQMILALHEASDLMGGKKCQGKQLDVSKLFQEIGIFVEYSLKSQRDRKSTGEWFRDFESQGETQTQSQSQQSQIIGKHTRDSTSFSIAPASRGDSNDNGKSRNSNAKGDRVGLQPDEFGGNRSSPSSTTIPTNDSNINKKSPKFSNSDLVEGAKTEIISKGNELDVKNMHLPLSSETISSDGNKVHRRSQNSPENVVVNNADDVSNMIDEVKTTNFDLLPSSETNFANKNGMLQKSLNAADDSAVDEIMNVVDTPNMSCTKTMELIGGEDEGKTKINTSSIRVSQKHDCTEVSSSSKTCDSRNKDQSNTKQADKTAPGKDEVYTVMKTNYDGRHQIQSEGNDKEAAAGAHEVGNNSPTFKRKIDEVHLPAEAGMGASLQADAESENVADVQNQDNMVSSNSEHLFTQQFVDCSDEDNVAHEFAFTQ